MSRTFLLAVLLGVSLANADLFGCTMRAATATVATNGTGSVACVSGDDDGVATLACTWKYAGLTSDPTAAHLHVGTDTTDGPPTFYFDPTGLDLTSGTAYQKFVASRTQTGPLPYWMQNGATGFAAQIAQCAGTNGCYFNLHTGTYGGGELRCELAPLSNTYAFDVILTPTPATDGAVNNSASSGTSSVWMAPVSSTAGAARVWGYQVQFITSSPVTNAHIHQADTVGGSGPVVVQFDWQTTTSRSTGSFVGVAMEGITSGNQPKSNWPTYPANFDTAINSHFCYINVHTASNGGGEIRANISPSAASHVAVTLMAVVFMIASWVSM